MKYKVWCEIEACPETDEESQANIEEGGSEYVSGEPVDVQVFSTEAEAEAFVAAMEDDAARKLRGGAAA